MYVTLTSLFSGVAVRVESRHPLRQSQPDATLVGHQLSLHQLKQYYIAYTAIGWH